MGTKYTSQSDTGYNASPPSDDGTAVSSNEVKWSFIKTKLADIVRTFCQDINSAILTHTDESVLDKGVTYTTTAADHKRTINVTAAATISLGDAATVATGYIVTVKNSHTAAITVDLVTGTDTLDGIVDGAASLGSGQAVTFVSNSSADGYLIQAENSRNQEVIKSADESVSSSTTLQDDDELQVTLAPSATYIMEFLLIADNASISVDFDYDFVEPDGTYEGQAHHYYGSGFEVHHAISDTTGERFLDINPGTLCYVRGDIRAESGVTGGVFKLQWAQNNSDASATVLRAGSYLKARRVG